jgi:hypothetical protein
MNHELIRQLREICDSDKLPLKTKLERISEGLKSCLNIGICFCEIKGKRWSYVAGSGEAICGNNRVQLTANWGIVTENNLDLNDDFQSCLNIIRKIITR